MKPSSLTLVASVPPSEELYREDVREALAKAGWREDSRGQLVAPNGALWVETNDALDSGIDAPDKSWSVAFDSDVPAVVIVAAALAAAEQIEGGAR
ncbi:hypothetical protein ACIPIC_02865 [Streptomyces collinus]|uniref:hypothetical protein n=1 Tax=Streptomyces collinus TaxID=42684 RepID=UPI003810E309